MGRERINLEPIKKDLLMYCETHALEEALRWLKTNYSITCSDTTVQRALRKWREASYAINPAYEGSNLEPWKKQIIAYKQKGHTVGETKNWIRNHYGIKCKEVIVAKWLREWKAEEIPAEPQKVATPVQAPIITEAEMILYLKHQGYRIYKEQYVKKGWGNSYKKKLVEL